MPGTAISLGRSWTLAVVVCTASVRVNNGMVHHWTPGTDITVCMMDDSVTSCPKLAVGGWNRVVRAAWTLVMTAD